MKKSDNQGFLSGSGAGLVCVLLVLILAAYGSAEHSWAPAGGRMMSRWAK
ncbi:MAG: hypothetical protein ACYTFK_06480 [Planctomycetota bacterium]